MTNEMNRVTFFGQRRRKLITSSIAIAWLLLAGFSFQSDDTAAFEHGLALLTRAYREIGFGYATEVDASRLMRAGIRGMLSELDPYSSYVDEQDRADVEMLTTGNYSGLGISVGRRGSRFIVTDLVEQRPRSESELLIGDEILSIDSITVSPAEPDLRRLLRGASGTPVRLRIRRPGVPGVMDITAIRRDVPVRTVSVVAEPEPGILYIKVDRFTRNTAELIREALLPFSSRPLRRGIVIDLRDNPGGLLEAAVDAGSLFLPQGAVLVSTRGRRHKEITARIYRSTMNPLASDVPLAVLVNGASASASEILAGAVQDHDRGVIIGAGTFGKGLVQNVIQLDQSRSMKLTTSTYYTPSGRCIQKPFRRSGEGEAVAAAFCGDSSLFRTLNRRRALHGSGGIEPDLKVRNDSGSALMRALRSNGAVIQFVAHYINAGKLTAPPDIDESIRTAFSRHIDTLEAFRDTEAEILLQRLKEALVSEGYSDKAAQRADALETSVRAGRPDRVLNNWRALRLELQSEFARQLFDRKAFFMAGMRADEALQRALSLLKDPQAYQLAMDAEH